MISKVNTLKICIEEVYSLDFLSFLRIMKKKRKKGGRWPNRFRRVPSQISKSFGERKSIVDHQERHAF